MQRWLIQPTRWNETYSAHEQENKHRYHCHWVIINDRKRAKGRPDIIGPFPAKHWGRDPTEGK